MSKFLDEYWKDQNEKLQKLTKQYADGQDQLKELKGTMDALGKLIAAAGKSPDPKPIKPSKPLNEAKENG